MQKVLSDSCKPNTVLPLLCDSTVLFDLIISSMGSDLSCAHILHGNPAVRASLNELYKRIQGVL